MFAFGTQSLQQHAWEWNSGIQEWPYIFWFYFEEKSSEAEALIFFPFVFTL